MADWEDLADPDETITLDHLSREAKLYSLKKRAIDLGITAEDILKHALTALFSPTTLDADLGRQEEFGEALSTRMEETEAAAVLLDRHERLHAEALGLLGDPASPGDTALVMAVELQGAHFQGIGEDGIRLLRLAGEVGGGCEAALPTSLRRSGLWREALRGVVAAVRGAVLVCATAERDRAEAVYHGALHVQDLSRMIIEALVDAIATLPEQATALQRLVEVATCWRKISAHAAAICEIEGSAILPPRPLPSSR